jgi:hypothetical protein
MMVKVVGGVLACTGLVVLSYVASSWGNHWTMARSALIAAGLILFASGVSSFLFRAKARP